MQYLRFLPRDRVFEKLISVICQIHQSYSRNNFKLPLAFGIESDVENSLTLLVLVATYSKPTQTFLGNSALCQALLNARVYLGRKSDGAGITDDKTKGINKVKWKSKEKSQELARALRQFKKK